MTFADTTIIIPSRNRPASVVALLDYLRGELDWACRIILVDQSDDGGKALSAALVTRGASVTHIVDDRRGTGAARNRGARECNTKWILFLDDDVRPCEHYWRALSDFVQLNSWADAIQGRTQQKDAWETYSRDREAWSRQLRAEPLQRAHVPRGWTAAEWYSSSPWGNYDAMTIGTGSGNLLILRQTFFGVGGFDERIQGLGDDREFGIRLWWLGYRTCFCPEAVAFHLREAEGGTRMRANWKRRFFGPDPSPGALYLYLKWMPGHAWREMIAWRVLKHTKRPWSLPLNVYRLMRSARAARKLHKLGPKYICEPLPRAAVVKNACDAYVLSESLGA